MKRFKHLATCQLSCNVTTASKCAIFDELQEKIRSIASRPAQKVTGKVQSRASRACHKLHVPVSDKSFPSPPPSFPPTFPPTPPQHPKNNHTVIRQSRALRACHKLHVPVSDKSFPPHPPSPPPHPPTAKIITRSFVDNVVKRFNHLCQASCNAPATLQRHNIF